MCTMIDAHVVGSSGKTTKSFYKKPLPERRGCQPFCERDQKEKIAPTTSC